MDFDDRNLEQFKKETLVIPNKKLPLFLKMTDEIDDKKNIFEEHLTDSKKATSTIETNLQITEVNNVSNLKLQYQKVDSDKRVESKIDIFAINEGSKIDNGKNNTLDIKWNLKSISGVSCQDN
ncbi:21156_t:CDS:2, partial [Gigaspora margarita]